MASRMITVLLVPLLVFPGFLLVRLLKAEDSSVAEETFFAIALGAWLVSFTTVALVGVLGLLVPIFVRLPLLVGVALAWSALLLFLLRRQGPLADQLRPPRPTRWDLVVLGLAAAVMVVALLNYDRTFFDEERCIIRSSVLPYFNYFRPGLPMTEQIPTWIMERNPFLFWNGGQREGMSFVLTPFLALFEYFGFRACFAFSHFVIAGSAWIVARRIVGGRWLPIAVMLLLCLNPYTMRMVDVDDNVFGLATGSLALAFLLRRPANWFWFMLPFGLYLGIRHEAVVCIPGVLAWILRGRPTQRRRALRQLLPGALVFTFPFLLYHFFLLVVYHTPYEGLVANPQGHHSFLGLVSFEIPGLLNWPFVEQLVRSPFSAFPTLVAFPLELLAGLGLLVWALVPGGLLWLRRENPAFLRLTLWWFLPVMDMLLIQSNWTEMDKMGIPNTVLVVVPIWAACGVPWLRGRSKRWWVPGVTLLALTLAVVGASKVEFEVDERGFAFVPAYMPEDFPLVSRDEAPGYVDADRQRLSTLVFVPHQPRRGDPSPKHLLRTLWRRWVTLRQDMRHPQFAYRRANVPELIRSMSGLDPLMHFPVTSVALATGELDMVDLAPTLAWTSARGWRSPSI